MSVILSEKKTIEFMLKYYCKKIHRTESICPVCSELLVFAQKRLELCKYGEQKTNCSKCLTHCYPPEKRKAIKEVMRFTGPRMIYLMPMEAIKHFLKRQD